MINSNTIANGILKAFITLLIAALILYFIFKIHLIFIYLIISLVLTLIGNPILSFLKRRLKFNNLFATITTLIIYILIILGFIMLFVPLVSDQSKNLSLLNTAQVEENIRQLTENIVVFLDSHNIDTSKLLKESNITSKIDFNFIPNFLNSFIGTLGNFGMGLASVLFITFFFLKDKIQFIVGIKKILPDSQEEKILNSLNKINHLLSNYFIGLLIQLFIVFILYLIVLLIFGVSNAVIIAFLCAILNIIPYIGPLIGSVFAGILTMINNLGQDFQSEILPTTIYVLIGFWIVQLIDNNLSQPIIFSKSVKSHPLEIFLVILIAGILFGIMGMVIAVPLFTILKVFAKEFFPDHKIIQIFTKNI